jgi:hypothetical protein
MNQPLAPSILKLLPGNEILIIEALDGQEFIYGDEKVFQSGTDSDFKNLGLNRGSEPTKETVFQIHELTERAVLADIFASLSENFDKLRSTQHQIKRFCVKYPGLLSQNECSTLFPFTMDGKKFVAIVRTLIGGLFVYVRHYKYDRIWHGDCHNFVVVPQLIP